MPTYYLLTIFFLNFNKTEFKENEQLLIFIKNGLTRALLITKFLSLFVSLQIIHRTWAPPGEISNTHISGCGSSLGGSEGLASVFTLKKGFCHSTFISRHEKCLTISVQ